MHKHKFLAAVIDITKEAISDIGYFFTFNMRYITNLLSIATPYVMYVLGQQLVLDRGKFAVGGEILIPVFVSTAIYFMRQTANRKNRGTHIPVPTERFTEVDDEGEITMEQDRVQELLLYTADLEDWMERKGWL